MTVEVLTLDTMMTSREALNNQKLQLDPLRLSNLKVPQTVIEGHSARGRAGRGVASFYTEQNELIDSYLKLPGEEEDRNEIDIPEYRIAMFASVCANVVLFCMQLTAALLSGSLALFATTLDAFMDLASSGVLMFAGKLAASHNYLTYPAGKNKYKTAGIIVFSTLMATLALQIWSQSIQALIAGTRDISITWVSLLIVGLGILVKTFLFLYCRLFAYLPSIQVLAQDHFNDIVFNSTGLLLSFLASRFEWWIDPVGAILIAILIMRSWGETALTNIRFIVGITADKAIINRLTYIALTHDPRILKVDTVRAYHSGYNVFVEVDLVLPPTMSLREAHDIGESLQIKLETLEQVDRAFVHLDWEWANHSASTEHPSSFQLRLRERKPSQTTRDP